ncbi:hypothetical protein SDC9_62524 [bioreactor metagenome]|uniref:Uncharacterized protein n=1 Tax=bioreactor metagenome TaxID=1076179 RepID=A0A644XK72_9ZZZZ
MNARDFSKKNLCFALPVHENCIIMEIEMDKKPGDKGVRVTEVRRCAGE